MKKYLIPILCSFLVGCEAKVQIESKPIPNPITEEIPRVLTSEGTPSGIEIGVINPENTGFYLDVNGDGHTDYVKLAGDSLLFSQGNGSSYASPKTILKIEGNIIAYNFQSSDGKVRLLYWDTNKKGWYRDVLGVVNGIPYFGNVEGQ